MAVGDATSRRRLLATGGIAVAGTAFFGGAATVEAAPPDAVATYVLRLGAIDNYSLLGPSGMLASYLDASTAVQAAIDALKGTGGAILLEAGSYTWAAPVRLPFDLPARLRILGRGGVIIHLSETAPRAFDFGQTEPHQTFRNIEIGGLHIDGGGVGGIPEHVILGTTTEPTLTGTGLLSYLNVQDLYVHDVYAFNIPTVETRSNFRTGIYISLQQSSAGEATQNWAKRLVFERVRVDGANAAISVVGAGSTDPGLNLFVDEIYIRDCRHDTGIIPTTGPWGASFHVGGRAFGGKVRITRCVSRGIGDTAFEINAMTDALIDGCAAEETRGYGFYLTNYNRPAHNGQRLTWRDCTVTRQHGAKGYGFRCNYNNGIRLGHVVVENCHVYRNTPDLNYVGEVAMFNAPMLSASIRGLTVQLEGINYSLSSATAAQLIGTNSNASIKDLTIRDVHVTLQGMRTSGSGSAAFPIVGLTGTQEFTIENLRVDGNLSNWGIDPVTVISLGRYSGSRLNGVIRNVHASLTGATLHHVWVGGGKVLSIPDRIRLSDFDASISQTENVVVFGDSANRSKIFIDNALTSTPLQPGTIATGASPFIYQNTSGRTELITIGGTDVSAIDFAPDGKTFTPITKMTQGMITVPHNSSIRVHYSSNGPQLTRFPTP